MSINIFILCILIRTLNNPVYLKRILDNSVYLYRLFDIFRILAPYNPPHMGVACLYFLYNTTRWQIVCEKKKSLYLLLSPFFLRSMSTRRLSFNGLTSTINSLPLSLRPRKKLHFDVTFTLQELINCTLLTGVLYAKIQLKDGGNFNVTSDR